MKKQFLWWAFGLTMVGLVSYLAMPRDHARFVVTSFEVRDSIRCDSAATRWGDLPIAEVWSLDSLGHWIEQLEIIAELDSSGFCQGYIEWRFTDTTSQGVVFDTSYTIGLRPNPIQVITTVSPSGEREFTALGGCGQELVNCETAPAVITCDSTIYTGIATDGCGNVQRYQFTFERTDFDTTAPVITVPADIRLCETDPFVFTATAVDDDGVTAISVTVDSVTTDSITIYTATAVDSCSNSASASTTVVRFDCSVVEQLQCKFRVEGSNLIIGPSQEEFPPNCTLEVWTIGGRLVSTREGIDPNQLTTIPVVQLGSGQRGILVFVLTVPGRGFLRCRGLNP